MNYSNFGGIDSLEDLQHGWVKNEGWDSNLDPSHHGDGSPDVRMDADLPENPQRPDLALEVVRVQEVREHLQKKTRGSIYHRVFLESASIQQCTGFVVIT